MKVDADVLKCYLPAFLAGTVLLVFLVWAAPTVSGPPKGSNVKQFAWLPKNIVEFKDNFKVVAAYFREHPVYGTILYTTFTAYVMAFVLPGKKTARMFYGAYYGLTQGMPAVLCATMLGACANYYMSRDCVRPRLEALYGQDYAAFKHKIEKRRGRAFWYILSLILSPFEPNAFITSACALAGVPLSLLVSTILIGTLPLIYVELTAGMVIADFYAGSIDWPQFLIAVFIFGVLAMLPKYLDTDEVDEDWLIGSEPIGVPEDYRPTKNYFTRALIRVRVPAKRLRVTRF